MLSMDDVIAADLRTDEGRALLAEAVGSVKPLSRYIEEDGFPSMAALEGFIFDIRVRFDLRCSAVFFDHKSDIRKMSATLYHGDSGVCTAHGLTIRETLAKLAACAWIDLGKRGKLKRKIKK